MSISVAAQSEVRYLPIQYVNPTCADYKAVRRECLLWDHQDQRRQHTYDLRRKGSQDNIEHYLVVIVEDIY